MLAAVAGVLVWRMRRQRRLQAGKCSAEGGGSDKPDAKAAAQALQVCGRGVFGR